MDRVYGDEFDQFRLCNDIFKAMTGEFRNLGQLRKQQWHEGAGLTGNGATATVCLWYNTTTGQLYYNPTADVGNDSILFARIMGDAPYLGYEDFLLIE